MDERYELIDVVASGASATVWRARDARLDRLVAIKRPHPAGEGTTAHTRFVAAARSTAAVSHPNLVTIFDTGTDEAGPYVVMEFVDGPSLAEVGAASGGAPALGADVASGLSALHAVGIVHGDVRPSNIILAPTGTKLTAFASARPADTSSQSAMPTPRFVAPEILAGGEPSQASDVYALGAVLSWMTGQAPADETLSAAFSQATSDVPAARPTAATLAARLHAIAPPRLAVVPATIPKAEGSPDETREFDITSMVVLPDANKSIPDDTEVDSPERRRWMVGLGIAVLVALIVWAALALSGDDDTPAPVAGDSTTEVPTTVPPTTAPAPDVTEGGPETTVADEEGGVFATVRVFVEFIRDAPRNVLDQTAAEDIISDVADGVSQAIRGNDEEAESRLADAAETVEEEIESETVVDRAIDLIGRIARQLGLDTQGFLEPSD